MAKPVGHGTSKQRTRKGPGPARPAGPRKRHRKGTSGPSEEQMRALPSRGADGAPKAAPASHGPRPTKLGNHAPKPGGRPTKPGARPTKPGARPGKPGAGPAKPGARPSRPAGRYAKPGARSEGSDPTGTPGAKPKRYGGTSSPAPWRVEATGTSSSTPQTKRFGVAKPKPKRARPARPVRPDKPGHADKPGRPDRATRPSRPATADRPVREDRVAAHPHVPPPAPAYSGEAAGGAPRTAFANIPGVDNRTAQALATIGITTPFHIQSAVIPSAVRGRDMLVQSPTGSGKTLAFGIPLVEQTKAGTKSPVALVLTPTRELAVQVAEDLSVIARGKNLATVAVYGGAPIADQARRASRAAIIVATPGRVADLMRTRRVDLSAVRMLVLDEADRMLDMGFQPQVDEIVEKLVSRRQTMLFSATLEGAVAKVAAAYTESPEVVRSDTAVGDGNETRHVLMSTTNGTKVDTVLDVLDDAARDLAVVFVRTKHGADRLCERLREYGLRSTAIHGGMSQAQRQREYRRFQAGTCDTLVATDVFARGMDLDRITHVVNYDLPEDADTYRHRAGRTGRAGRAGTAVTMVIPSQMKVVRHMVREAGLPSDLVATMRRPSGKRWRQVDEAQRFRDGNRAPSGAGGAVRAGEQLVAGSGTVAGYDDEKGFGFITPATGTSDVFFHRSALARGTQVSAVSRGATVTFDIDPTADRARAATVRLARGGPVRATRTGPAQANRTAAGPRRG